MDDAKGCAGRKQRDELSDFPDLGRIIEVEIGKGENCLGACSIADYVGPAGCKDLTGSRIFNEVVLERSVEVIQRVDHIVNLAIVTVVVIIFEDRFVMMVKKFHDVLLMLREAFFYICASRESNPGRRIGNPQFCH